ncbi:hypothetical protein M9458_050512 [Cirrhinus mrigala]|uniref:Uncharacterized protein n=1 Tax=Cirrhinus mrigala TaxID=683832 RepID=A0ABD0N022_CIRMR
MNMMIVRQVAMQNQINTNPESPDTLTIHTAAPQFIIGPGGVVNLAGLVTPANGSKSTGELTSPTRAFMNDLRERGLLFALRAMKKITLRLSEQTASQSSIKAPLMLPLDNECFLTGNVELMIRCRLTLVSDAVVAAEEVITADSVDGAIQQQVITIVTDGIQLGNLQTGAGIGQPIIVTMPDGQQVLTVSDTEVAEETVISDEPTVKRQRVKEEDDDQMTETQDIQIQQTISLEDFQEKVALLKQLEEANREAQKYRQQFLKKEQEAEAYRQKLEAITRQSAKKAA